MCKIFYILILLFVSTRLLSQETVNNYAVLIGTHNFDTPKLQSVFDNKKIFITVNDIDKSGTSGVENDLDKMGKFLIKRGFNNIVKLYDKNKKDVLDTLLKISNSVNSNSNILFYFSGHGGQVFDIDKDEALMNENDNMDEFFFLKDDIIIDDEISVFFRKLPKGTQIIQIMDACHSGSAFAIVSIKPKEIITKKQKQQIDTFPLDKIPPEILEKKNNINKLVALFPNPIIYFGASSDNSITFGNQFGSFFTNKIIDTILFANQEGIELTYNQLFKEINNNKDREFNYLPFDNDLSKKIAIKIK